MSWEREPSAGPNAVALVALLGGESWNAAHPCLTRPGPSSTQYLGRRFSQRIPSMEPTTDNAFPDLSAIRDAAAAWRISSALRIQLPAM